MVIEIIVFAGFLTFLIVVGCFLHAFIELEEKQAQEYKERQDALLETLNLIHGDLLKVANSCNVISHGMCHVASSIDDLLDFDDE